MVVIYQASMTLTPATANWSGMGITAESSSSAVLYDAYTVCHSCESRNPVSSGGPRSPIQSFGDMFREDDSLWHDEIRAGSASAAFAATTLMAGGAMALLPTPDAIPSLNAGADNTTLWLTLLAIGVGAFGIPYLYKRIWGQRTKNAAGQLNLQSGKITINGKEFPNFDYVYKKGNRDLEGTYVGKTLAGLAGMLGGFALVAGGTYVFLKEHKNPWYWVATAFLGVSGMQMGFKAVKNAWNNGETYMRLSLQKETGQITMPSFYDLSVIKPKDIAKWYNVLFELAFRASTQRVTLDSFIGALESGKRVVDKRNSRVLNFAALMGDEMIKPLVDFVPNSPDGVMIFKALAMENPVAKKLDADAMLMSGKSVGWSLKHLSDPVALDAVKWMVAHGNTDIVEFIKKYKDAGDQNAINIWNQLSLAMVAIPAQPVAATPAQAPLATAPQAPTATAPAVAPAVAEKPVSSTEAAPVTFADALAQSLKGFEGQAKAVEWLRGMHAQLKVDEARQKNGKTPRTKVHAAFSGPEGTGKHMLAYAYSNVLGASGRLNQPAVVEIDGKQLLENDWKKHFINDKVTVLDLSTLCSTCKTALEKRLEEVEEHIKGNANIAVVLLGDVNTVSQFLGEYPKFAKLIANRVFFDELKGNVLSNILLKMANEDGFQLSSDAEEKMRRVMNDKKGGSSVARNYLDKALRHQSNRLANELEDPNFDHSKLTRLEAADFSNGYGPIETHALEKLQAMTGLNSVKESLQRIVAVLRESREREQEGLIVTKPSLHALFVGNPGTGKTTVAGIYAEALKEMGYLSKGQLVVIKPSEIVGSVIGEAEKLTRQKLDSALGGVLFLDEAHNLLSNGTGGDIYGKKALETILTYMEEHRDDIVVIFGGYPEQMEDLLDSDPGLRRRFMEKIHFADYTVEELGSILDKMALARDYTMSAEAKRAALDLLGRQRSAKDFGNAGAVRNLFEATVLRQSQRLQGERSAGGKPTKDEIKQLTINDFEGANAPDPDTALKEMDNFVGLRRVKQQLREYLAMVNFAEARGGDPKDAFEPYFLFGGPPGTGKTSVAGVLGKVFKGLGLLPDDKVVAVNALDLIAGYVGQTSEKAKKTIESALGGVLLIDEIGGLANSPGGFAGDAINQILSLLEKYRGRLIVVVAGYDDHINAFLRLDDGLSRRFATRFTFESLTAEEAIVLFDKRVKEARPSLTLSKQARESLPGLIEKLRSAPAWASGGDIRSLVSFVIRKQAIYWQEHPDIDINTIPLSVLEEAVLALIEKKEHDARPIERSRFLGGATGADDAPLLQYATEGAQSAQHAEKPRTAEEGGHHHEIDAAFAKHAEEAVQELGLSPEEARAQMESGGPDSALAKKIAEKTNEKPDMIAQKLMELLHAAATQPQTLGWVCMYCGNSNPDCPYKGRPDRERFNALRRPAP